MSLRKVFKWGRAELTDKLRHHLFWGTKTAVKINHILGEAKKQRLGGQIQLRLGINSCIY